MRNVVWILVAVMGAIGLVASVIGKDGFYASKAIPAALIGLVLGAIYYIPAFIATSRKHPNELAIVVLNAVGGWTFLGWVGSLVWSLLRTKNESQSK